MGIDENPASRLCKSCGICCEGLLHTHGVLEPGEQEGAEALGLEMVQGDKPAFALPCPRFAGCCTIYDERPKACRGFRCALLRRLDDGDIGLEEALKIVREARRLAFEAMPNASPIDLAREFRMKRRIGRDENESIEVHQDRLGFIALALYLDKHFVLPRDGNFYSVQSVTGGSL